MNFNPTLAKTVLSIVLGAIIGVFSSEICYTSGMLNETVISTTNPVCFHQFDAYAIMGFVSVFLFVYCLWSLMQER